MTGEPRRLQAADGASFDVEPVVPRPRAALRRHASAGPGRAANPAGHVRPTAARGRDVARARCVQRRPGAGARPRERAVRDAAGVRRLRWPAFAEALPPGPVRDQVAAVADIRALIVVDEEKRRIRRLELRNGDGKTVVRLEVDEPAGSGSARPRDGDGPRAARVRRPGQPRRRPADRARAAAGARRRDEAAVADSQPPASTGTRRRSSCSLRRCRLPAGHERQPPRPAGRHRHRVPARLPGRGPAHPRDTQAGPAGPARRDAQPLGAGVQVAR